MLLPWVGTHPSRLLNQVRDNCPEAQCPEVQCPDFNSGVLYRTAPVARVVAKAPRQHLNRPAFASVSITDAAQAAPAAKRSQDDAATTRSCSHCWRSMTTEASTQRARSRTPPGRSSGGRRQKAPGRRRSTMPAEGSSAASPPDGSHAEHRGAGNASPPLPELRGNSTVGITPRVEQSGGAHRARIARALVQLRPLAPASEPPN